jgi:hypothetical protein
MSKKPRGKKGQLKSVKKVECDYEFPNVFVATPAYDGKVDSDYARALAESANVCTFYSVHFQAAVMANGAFIELSRNMFARIFLEEKPECTHLFFIDSDLGWPREAFINAVLQCTEEHPVVSCAYRRREEKENYPYMYWPEPGHEPGDDRLWVKENAFLQCKRVATGFLCIRRNIVEEMCADVDKIIIHGQDPIPNLFKTKIDEDNRFVGEDFCWSDDYIKKYDRPLEVLPDYDFVHGGRKGNFAQWLSKEVESLKQKTDTKLKRIGNK